MTAHWISAQKKKQKKNSQFPQMWFVEGHLNSSKLLDLTLLMMERLTIQPGGVVKSSLQGARKFNLSMKPI